jgi:phosphoadenosine phosphosulfate reductase
VPGQYAASPIQKWTALHVWLFLFARKAPINPWYHRGLDRIGCFLCPASNLSELHIIKKYYEPYQRWEDFLQDYASGRANSKDWLKLGLWRWRKVPKEIQNLLPSETQSKEIAIDDRTITLHPRMDKILDLKDMPDGIEINSIGDYKFISLGGFEDCEGKISLEGIFNFKFDGSRAANLLNILGEVTVDESSNSCSIGEDITLFFNGTLSIKGDSKEQIQKKLKQIHNILIRSNDCVQCGICVSRCPENVITVDEGLNLDPLKCNHCKKCLGPCTVIDFEKDKSIEF